MSKPKIEYTEKKVIVDSEGSVIQDAPVINVESETVEAEVIYDDVSKTARFTTTEGKEVVIKCPKTRQLINLRKQAKIHNPDDDELIMAFLFTSACVVKYGDADKLTFDECLDMELQDSMTLVKCLEFFRSSLSALSSMG